MLCTYRVYMYDPPTNGWKLVLNTRLFSEAKAIHRALMEHGHRAIVNVDSYKFKRNLPANPDRDILKHAVYL